VSKLTHNSKGGLIGILLTQNDTILSSGFVRMFSTGNKKPGLGPGGGIRGQII